LGAHESSVQRFTAQWEKQLHGGQRFCPSAAAIEYGKILQMNGASDPRTLKVPQLMLSNGDSVLVHLEIDSLMNDPLNFFMTKDCGSEFPLMLVRAVSTAIDR
jgi:hypothetical protein